MLFTRSETVYIIVRIHMHTDGSNISHITSIKMTTLIDRVVGMAGVCKCKNAKVEKSHNF